MKIKNCNIESNDHGINVTVNKVPNLFRYQSINKYTTNALLKDELWGTIPIAFNDPYDMVLLDNKFTLPIVWKRV